MSKANQMLNAAIDKMSGLYGDIPTYEERKEKYVSIFDKPQSTTNYKVFVYFKEDRKETIEISKNTLEKIIISCNNNVGQSRALCIREIVDNKFKNTWSRWTVNKELANALDDQKLVDEND